MRFRSCGTRSKKPGAGERVQAAARATRSTHHVGEDEERNDLVHVQLEQHAGELSGSRRIHRLDTKEHYEWMRERWIQDGLDKIGTWTRGWSISPKNRSCSAAGMLSTDTRS